MGGSFPEDGDVALSPHGVVIEALRSAFLGTLGLTVLLLVALLLTVFRRAGPRLCDAVRPAAALAIVAQAGHFAEEAARDFQTRFPELLGLPPWSDAFFFTLNLGWIAVWVVSTISLSSDRRWSQFPLWFLALGGMANAVAHPVMAAVDGGYFPGLGTSPLVGVAGVLLFLRLRGTTRPA